MEVFRELFVRGSTEQLASLMGEISRSLPSGWARDQAAEARLRAVALRNEPTYCFTFEGNECFPSAAVFITEKDPGTFYASNVVPRDKGQLSHSEYNAILEAFCEDIVRPCVAKVGGSVELTGNRADLSHWLSDSAARKLRDFSIMANKSTGSSHPHDQERWIDFIVTAHREGTQLDAPTLRRWLIEVEGWSPEIADQLAGEYEFGGEVLNFSDGPRVGV